MFKTCATLLLTTLFILLNQLAAATEYRIGAQDKLRIKVHEWPALSDDMSVSPAGTLSLPIVGMLTVAGKTATAIANEISDQLQRRAKLPEAPFTSVEILQFRPFYVIGDVQRPGDYPYRPQMTVLMAMSIAGGAYRPPETASVRATRDILVSQSSIAALENTKRALTLRKARLEAELNGQKNSLALNRDVTYPPGSEEAEELAMMRARTESFEAQLTGFHSQIRHGQEEIELLDARAKTNMRQQLSAEKEAVGLRRLNEKGLGLTFREELLERLTAKIEGDQREIDVHIARVRQTVSQAESSLARLASERERDLRTELRQVAVQLDETDQQILLQYNLIAEAETLEAAHQLMRIDKSKLHLRFRIARADDGGTAEFVVGQHDQVKPGDVVIVEQFMGGAIREDASAQIGQTRSPLRR